MELNAGEQVYYRVMPDMARRTGTVVSFDEAEISLRVQATAPADTAAGRYLLISEIDTDIDYYNVITGREGDILRLKRMWTGKRGYFRVNDVFPVICKKVEGSPLTRRSRIFPGHGLEPASIALADETISPALWKMLVDINTKLGLILERLNLENEGLARAEAVPVNISASGIRLILRETTRIGDLMEIKMLLPTYPPAGIILYGNVVRVEELENGECEAALRFSDVDEDVQDVLIQYTLNRQRESIRKLKEWEGGY